MAFDPDAYSIDEITTELEGEDAGRIRVQVVIRENVTVRFESDGQVIDQGDYDDDSWATLYDDTVGGERGEVIGRFVAFVVAEHGYDEDDADALAWSMRGSEGLPSGS